MNDKLKVAQDAWVDALEDLLSTTTVTVVFTKVSDGTERTMVCTKNFELIPSSDYPKQEALPTAKNNEIVKVYDMEAKAWRSFRKDSIISFWPCFSTQ